MGITRKGDNILRGVQPGEFSRLEQFVLLSEADKLSDQIAMLHCPGV